MKRTQKFTLVEILVTIAIIATLASLLFSSIKTTKDISKRAVCLSNLSQIRTVVELHRKDAGELPYSENWLNDFSFASVYLSEGKSLYIFKCPGDDDTSVSTYEDLLGSTSYYYIPTHAQLEKHLEDGIEIGINDSNLDLLQGFKYGVI